VCPIVGFCVSLVESWGVLLPERRLNGPLVIIKGTLKFLPEEIDTRYVSKWVASAVRLAIRTL